MDTTLMLILAIFLGTLAGCLFCIHEVYKIGEEMLGEQKEAYDRLISIKDRRIESLTVALEVANQNSIRLANTVSAYKAEHRTIPLILNTDNDFVDLKFGDDNVTAD